MARSTSRTPLLRAGLVAVALLALSCGGGLVLRPLSYAYFEAPAPDDPWSPKIQSWQSRERADREAGPSTRTPAAVGGAGEASVSSPSPSTDLRAKYAGFRAERRRQLARELASWIQGQAKEHYLPDGPLDHWATLEETLRTNGDDCDGLELLAFHFLRDLGFAKHEVYRAIVHRPSDGQHHMVTFWFEDPQDPWVIDPTGAMTSGMPHMSEVPGWVPLKIFSDDEEYSVRASAPDPGAPGRRAALR